MISVMTMDIVSLDLVMLQRKGALDLDVNTQHTAQPVVILPIIKRTATMMASAYLEGATVILILSGQVLDMDCVMRRKLMVLDAMKIPTVRVAFATGNLSVLPRNQMARIVSIGETAGVTTALRFGHVVRGTAEIVVFGAQIAKVTLAVGVVDATEPYRLAL